MKSIVVDVCLWNLTSLNGLIIRIRIVCLKLLVYVVFLIIIVFKTVWFQPTTSLKIGI